MNKRIGITGILLAVMLAGSSASAESYNSCKNSDVMNDTNYLSRCRDYFVDAGTISKGIWDNQQFGHQFPYVKFKSWKDDDVHFGLYPVWDTFQLKNKYIWKIKVKGKWENALHTKRLDKKHMKANLERYGLTIQQVRDKHK